MGPRAHRVVRFQTRLRRDDLGAPRTFSPRGRLLVRAAGLTRSRTRGAQGKAALRPSHADSHSWACQRGSLVPELRATAHRRLAVTPGDARPQRSGIGAVALVAAQPVQAQARTRSLRTLPRLSDLRGPPWGSVPGPTLGRLAPGRFGHRRRAVPAPATAAATAEALSGSTTRGRVLRLGQLPAG